MSYFIYSSNVKRSTEGNEASHDNPKDGKDTKHSKVLLAAHFFTTIVHKDKHTKDGKGNAG